MAEHVWERIGDGTAYYCAVCRMRVDNDEFSSEVEDSLCAPYVPAVAEHVSTPLQERLWNEMRKSLDMEISPPVVRDGGQFEGELDMSPGSTKHSPFVGVDLGSPGGDMSCITFDAQHPPSLVEFVRLCGIVELTAWQLQVLQTFDKDISYKRRARGIPH